MKIDLKEFRFLSNQISLFRLLLFFPIITLFFLIEDKTQFNIYLIVIILIACISDLLDGYYARRRKEITELGKIIDPLADKILTAEIIILLFVQGLIPNFYFYLVVSRDLFILVGGILVSKKIQTVLPSDYIGKATILSIGLFLIYVLVNPNHNNLLYHIILWSSTGMIFMSIVNYFIRAINNVKKR